MIVLSTNDNQLLVLYQWTWECLFVCLFAHSFDNTHPSSNVCVWMYACERKKTQFPIINMQPVDAHRTLFLSKTHVDATRHRQMEVYHPLVCATSVRVHCLDDDSIPISINQLMM